MGNQILKGGKLTSITFVIREMAEEETLEGEKAVELQEEDVKQDNRTTKTSKDTELELTIATASTNTTTTAAATQTTGKRSRNGGKEQGRNKNRGTRPAVYGNYDYYYGYRVLKDLEDDPRLKHFKQEWFEGKDCLDVGCNAGNLTISIAKNFSCKTMVGVDIDKGLVDRACKLLEKTAKKLTKVDSRRKSSLDANSLNGEDVSNKTSIDLTSNILDSGLHGEELLKRVSFKAENFVTHVEAQPTYDTVLCLSVTKWVHLNWGDNGLIKLFAKIRNLLRPGGILVLEPQPWKSYKSNYQISEVVRRNFHEIVLRPDQFKEVLLDRVGFRSMQSITEKVVNSAEGFSRPIYLLRC
eukprot:c3177_g1_i1 orf=19-1080(+)